MDCGCNDKCQRTLFDLIMLVGGFSPKPLETEDYITLDELAAEIELQRFCDG